MIHVEQCLYMQSPFYRVQCHRFLFSLLMLSLTLAYMKLSEHKIMMSIDSLCAIEKVAGQDSGANREYYSKLQTCGT